MERLMLDTASKAGLPRLLLIEGEYHLTMQQTELAWVQELADEIEVGTFEGLNGWRQISETGEQPDWTLDLSMLDKLKEQAEEGITPD